MKIYVITNLINKKKYIGLDTHKKKPRKRWGDHLSAARNNPVLLIDKKIKQYGFWSFRYEEIYRANNIADLEEKEKLFINFFQSDVTLMGYNVAKGGKSVMFGRKHSKESRLKMSISRKNSEKAKAATFSLKAKTSHGFVCVSPTNQVFVLSHEGLRGFCAKHKISPQAMHQMARFYAKEFVRSVYKQHNGWLCFRNKQSYIDNISMAQEIRKKSVLRRIETGRISESKYLNYFSFGNFLFGETIPPKTSRKKKYIHNPRGLKLSICGLKFLRLKDAAAFFKISKPTIRRAQKQLGRIDIYLEDLSLFPILRKRVLPKLSQSS
jgi:group I intron endonuclease